MTVRVYFYRRGSKRLYVIYHDGRTTSTTRHTVAHEYIAKTLPDGYRFYLVLAQPDVVEKTNALLKVLKLLPHLQGRVGALVSFALMDSITLECVKKLKKHGVEIMLDSGAFHVLNKKIPISRFQSYRDQYLKFVNKHIHLFDWVVTMDIPCDQRPDPSIQQMPNKQKIELTIENTLYLIDRIDDPRKFVAVVQGYAPEEYAYCCDLLRQHGIVTARTGIGSLCVRKYDKSTIQDVVQVINTVRDSLPGWVKLHAFGLNIRFLRHAEIRNKLNSSDSDAWVYSYSKFGRIPLLNADGEIFEIDTATLTRDYRKITLDKETIYFISIRTYLEKLHVIGVL